MAISLLLHHERAARLVEFHARDAKNPGLEDVITATAAKLKASGSLATESTAALVQRAAQQVFAQRLMDLGANESASSDVRAIARHFVGRLPALLFPVAECTTYGRVACAHGDAHRRREALQGAPVLAVRPAEAAAGAGR